MGRLLATDEELRLNAAARTLYQCFEERSPQSTRDVKREADLQGRAHSAAYESAMKELWTHMLIVGFGEKDDGAFHRCSWAHRSGCRKRRGDADTSGANQRRWPSSIGTSR
jgi:hypothetical protein